MKGTNVCRVHGGMAPQVREAGRRRILEQQTLKRLGLLHEVSPEEALLQQVYESAGNVALYRTLIETLRPDVLGVELDEEGNIIRGLAGPTGSKAKRHEAEPHVWVNMYDRERDRLVRYAKAAADIGISDRLVRLAERQGELVAKIYERALTDPAWGLSESQRALGRQVLGRHLRSVG